MTKEEIKSALNGEKPNSEQIPDGKVNFTNKVGFANKEQSKYLEEILFMKDEQESFKKVSHFISGNIDDAKVRDVMRCNTIMIGAVACPFQCEIEKEGFAFNKDGYFCYAIRLMETGIAFGIDKSKSLSVTPWDKPYDATAIIELVRSRKEEIHKKVGFLQFFHEQDNDEIADAIAKAFEGGVSE